MRVVIVGGSGLIGRALCHSLTKDGHQVIISSRHPEGVAGLPESVSIKCWSDSLVDGADAVVCCQSAIMGHFETEHMGMVMRGVSVP